MKLNKQTNRFVEELKTQATEHILYASQFDVNLRNVENFERKHGVMMHDVSLLKNYLMFLMRDEQCVPCVRENLRWYLEYIQKKLMTMSSMEQATKKADLEKVQELFKEASHNYVKGKMAFRRPLLCSSLAQKTKVLFSDFDVMEQQMIDFIPQEFYYSSTLINQDEIVLDGLIQDPVFLQYCNFLVNSSSSLLYTDCFSEQIMSILDANMKVQEQNQAGMPVGFFKENKRVMKRIRESL